MFAHHEPAMLQLPVHNFNSHQEKIAIRVHAR